MEEEDYNDVFQLYYKLKHQYDEKINREKNKLIKSTTMTTLEKRQKFKALKIKCINCGQIGGTSFKQDGDILEAKCLAKNPYNLHIKLERAKYVKMNEEDLKLKELILNEKSNVIANKLNYLFGYQTEKSTIDKFNLIKSKIIGLVKAYENLSIEYLNVTNNEEKNSDLKKYKSDMIVLIDTIKASIMQYEETNEDIHIKDAIEIYIEKMMPLEKKIMDTKYKKNTIVSEEVSKDIFIYHLVQQEYTLNELMYKIDGTRNKIIINKK